MEAEDGKLKTEAEAEAEAEVRIQIFADYASDSRRFIEVTY